MTAPDGGTSPTVDVAAVGAWVRAFAERVHEQREHLTQLDAAIGDADHGTNVDRGMTSAVAALDADPPQECGPLLSKVGMTLVSTTGGASGPLLGTLFMRMGSALGASADATADQLAAALRAGLEGVVARGKAEAGDKTMYDALAPAIEAFESALAAGRDAPDAAAQAASAAAAGRDATSPMLARKGRASYLGERSVGHVDPGAATTALLLDALAAVLRAPEL